MSAPTEVSGKPRALIFLIAGLVVLAAFLVVTKVVMAPAGKSTTTATTVPVTHGIVRSVAGAASAAGKKLDATTGAGATATTAATAQAAPGATTTTAANSGGPQPNTVRNPFAVPAT